MAQGAQGSWQDPRGLLGPLLWIRKAGLPVTQSRADPRESLGLGPRPGSQAAGSALVSPSAQSGASPSPPPPPNPQALTVLQGHPCTESCAWLFSAGNQCHAQDLPAALQQRRCAVPVPQVLRCRALPDLLHPRVHAAGLQHEQQSDGGAHVAPGQLSQVLHPHCQVCAPGQSQGRGSTCDARCALHAGLL